MKIVIAVLASLLFFSCHLSQKATDTKPATKINEPETASDGIVPLNSLVLSFYSKGNGADTKYQIELENFISEYASRTGTPIPYKKVQWGKEGEADYCIQLSGWDINAGIKLKQRLQDFLRGIQVNISENRPCRE